MVNDHLYAISPIALCHLSSSVNCFWCKLVIGNPAKINKMPKYRSFNLSEEIFFFDIPFIGEFL